MHEYLVRLWSEQPWALTFEKFRAIDELVDFRASGGRLSEAEIRERIGPRKERADVSLWDLEASAWVPIEAGAAAPIQSGGRSVVAVLPVYGVLMPRANMMSDISGGTSIERLTARFRALMDDSGVKGIVLDVDSPGGSVFGVQEFADEIRKARGAKPIETQVNPVMGSGAVWIGSQADGVAMTPSGQAGAIGVYTSREDRSEQMKREGRSREYISAGKHKVAASTGDGPLTPEVRAALQEVVDDRYKEFITAVAKGRGVTPKAVENGFGQGTMMTAKRSIAEGLADRVATLEDTIKLVARGGSRKDKADPGSKAELDPADPRADAGADGQAEELDRALALARLRGL